MIIYEDQENGIFNPRVEVYDAKLHEAYVRYPGVGDWIFYKCTALETITFAEQSADMPSLQYLGGWMFGGCSSLKSVTLPASLTTMDSVTARAQATYGNFTVSPFLDCVSLTNITVDADSTHLKAENGDVYSYDGTIFFLHPLGDTTEKLTIPEGVKEVAAYAFYKNQHIKSVVFPTTMQKLGTYALAWVNSLEEVEFLTTDSIEFGFGSMYNISLYPAITSSSGFVSYDFNQKPLSTPLVRIIFHTTTVPKLGTSVWIHSTENAKFGIYVPDEILDACKEDSAWTDYISYLKALSTLVR